MAATGGDFGGFDDQMDPELALALRVSLEEQRNRQQQENNDAAPPANNEAVAGEDDDDAMLRAALELSMATDGQQQQQQQVEESPAQMTEEEQLAYALRLSMEQSVEPANNEAAAEEEMETDDMADAEYMENVLQNLPGMDPDNKNDQDAMDQTKDQ